MFFLSSSFYKFAFWLDVIFFNETNTYPEMKKKKDFDILTFQSERSTCPDNENYIIREIKSSLEVLIRA